MARQKLKEVVINQEWCKGCGICSNECPQRAITMVEEPQ